MRQDNRDHTHTHAEVACEKERLFFLWQVDGAENIPVLLRLLFATLGPKRLAGRVFTADMLISAEVKWSV